MNPLYQHWNGKVIHMDNTPNVVIKNPQTRLIAGAALFGLAFLTAVAALFFSFFPEVTAGTDVPMRTIAFINAFISLAASTFGLVVSTPNVPRSPSA